jgi:hypothetical protein
MVFVFWSALDAVWSDEFRVGLGLDGKWDGRVVGFLLFVLVVVMGRLVVIESGRRVRVLSRITVLLRIRGVTLYYEVVVV